MLLQSASHKAYRFLPVCLFICLVTGVASGQSIKEPYAAQLVAAAAAQDLAKERTWRVLLHYPGESSRSKIQDATFFLSPTGDSNPSTELTATLAGLFQPAELGDQHPRCRFPARYEWLREKLAIEETKIPSPVCQEQNQYLAKLNPRSASLMFPSAYMNSPASMFGHTFIRIDGEYQSELLSYAVNYAAHTDETSGVIYAWKGVFGLYQGQFSIMPQYIKIKEYSSLEHRDIWEYRLNLAPDEVRRLALHTWELRDIRSDYYFFDENCSYNLLFLIEAGRPSAHLAENTQLWVLPIDTIGLVRNSGLIASSAYRPSQGKKIRAISRHLDSQEIDLAQRLAYQQTKVEAHKEIQNPAIYDLAVELLQHSYTKQGVSQEEYRKQLLELLKTRSRFGRVADDPYPIAIPSEPGQGHASTRMQLSTGLDRGTSFVQAGIRPSYHALDDPDLGYLPGAQIRFIDTQVRYYSDTEKARLEQLTFVGILSLADFESIYRRVSWKIEAGFAQTQNRNGNDVTVLKVNSGAGLAFETKLGLLFGLLETEGEIGQQLRDWYSVGFGASVGLVNQVNERLKLQISGKALGYPLGEKRLSFEGAAQSTFSINRNNALGIKFSYSNTEGHGKDEAMLSWNYYF